MRNDRSVITSTAAYDTTISACIHRLQSFKATKVYQKHLMSADDTVTERNGTFIYLFLTLIICCCIYTDLRPSSDLITHKHDMGVLWLYAHCTSFLYDVHMQLDEIGPNQPFSMLA